MHLTGQHSEKYNVRNEKECFFVPQQLNSYLDLLCSSFQFGIGYILMNLLCFAAETWSTPVHRQNFPLPKKNREPRQHHKIPFSKDSSIVFLQSSSYNQYYMSKKSCWILIVYTHTQKRKWLLGYTVITVNLPGFVINLMGLVWFAAERRCAADGWTPLRGHDRLHCPPRGRRRSLP